MPKSIVVIDEMPLTSVGKIFKPDLRRRQTECALKQALLVAGVQAQTIRIETDPAKHGVCAVVALAQTGMEPAAKAVLGRFPFSYRLM